MFRNMICHVHPCVVSFSVSGKGLPRTLSHPLYSVYVIVSAVFTPGSPERGRPEICDSRTTISIPSICVSEL